MGVSWSRQWVLLYPLGSLLPIHGGQQLQRRTYGTGRKVLREEAKDFACDCSFDRTKEKPVDQPWKGRSHFSSPKKYYQIYTVHDWSILNRPNHMPVKLNKLFGTTFTIYIISPTRLSYDTYSAHATILIIIVLYKTRLRPCQDSTISNIQLNARIAFCKTILFQIIQIANGIPIRYDSPKHITFCYMQP